MAMYKDGEINLDDFVQTRTPNLNELSRFLVMAKGSKRTMTQFAQECGSSPSTLSRILNLKITDPLNKKLLLAIADHASSGPDGSNMRDYILLSLLNANGMTDSKFHEEKTYADMAEKNYIYNEQVFSLENEIKNILTFSMLNRGYGIKYVDYIKDSDIKREFCGFLSDEFVVHVTDHDPDYFRFHILATLPNGIYGNLVEPGMELERIMEYEAEILLKRTAILFLTDVWEPVSLAKVRTSLVLNDKELFDALKNLLRDKSVNSIISLVLVDVTGKDVVDEWQMRRFCGITSEYLFKNKVNK